jgi:uncharacterized repeat protein (TIGR01451 family)
MGEVYVANFGDNDNPYAVSFFGTVFEDRNVNGAPDLPEPPISGVTVTLMGDPVPSVTNEWGQYTFLIAGLGTYTVTETDPSGYVSTVAIPGSPQVSAADSNTLVAVVSGLGTDLGDNLYGDAQATQVITVSGYVWDDNGAGSGNAGDGIWDAPDEPGLSGAIVSLSSGLARATGADGSFQLYAPAGQAITITEADPANYVSTGAIAGNDADRADDDTIVVRGTLGGGAASEGHRFGDVLPADLAVLKSDDPDPMVAGMTLTYTLTYTNYGPGVARPVYITDTLPDGVAFGGVVQQDALLAGPVQADSQLSWSMPDLPEGTSDAIVFTVTVDVSSLGTLQNTVVITSSTPDTNLGNNTDDESTTATTAAIIQGTVFNDTNGNGVQDGTEVGIPDVLVTLDGTLTATTDVGGGYSFSIVRGGVHSVVETDLAGYFSTTPNRVQVDVVLGSVYTVDYGDAASASAGFATVYGTVFEDVDGNGNWDSDELGIPGVTVTLDGSTTATTGGYGGFSFSTAVAGTHNVVETDPPGYFSTTPNTITLSVSLGQGYGVDFGDALATACSCPPDSYEQDDLPAQAGDLDAGSPQEHDFCDDAIDWMRFTAQAGNTYTVTTSSWGQRADTSLALLAPDGSTVLAMNDDYEGTTDFSSRIVWQAPANGIYYIRVTERADLTGCATDYRVWLERMETDIIYLPLVIKSPAGLAVTEIRPTGIITHTCPDPWEPDDTWQQAQAIEIDVAQAHSFDSDPSLYAADKDFVSFDLVGGQTITFSVTAVTNTVTLLELYDEYGEGLNLTGSGQLVWTAPSTGRYHLSVSPQTTSFGCADTVGYELLAQIKARADTYLPIVLREPSP